MAKGKIKIGNQTTASSGDQALDRTDKAILRQLQKDASISNVALASKVNLSPPACLRRVDRLASPGSGPRRAAGGVWQAWRGADRSS